MEQFATSMGYIFFVATNRRRALLWLSANIFCWWRSLATAGLSVFFFIPHEWWRTSRQVYKW